VQKPKTSGSQGVTPVMVAYIRIWDMREYCRQVAPLISESHPGLATKVSRAEQSFTKWLKELEDGGQG
jgi:hypothetical protein